MPIISFYFFSSGGGQSGDHTGETEFVLERSPRAGSSPTVVTF